MNDRLIDTFLAEAHELIVDLEKALLQLENDQQNKDAISAVFRAMHTIKGAAGMFGYAAVNEITHHLESIYQDIRDCKREMNEAILRITFKTLDHLRILLQVPPAESVGNNSEHAELLQAVQSLGVIDPAASVKTKQVVEAESATYYINVLPKSNILKNGTNPLYLVDDLLVLGNGISLPYFNDLPVIDNLVPDVSYMGFEVLLCTDKSEDDISGVFIFVEDLCDVTIKKLGKGNLLKSITAEDNPWYNRNELLPLGFEAVQSALTKKNFNKTSATETVRKATAQKTSNIRVNSDQLDDLMNLVSELVTTQARLALFSNQNSSAELDVISENIEKITRRLRDNAFTMSLVPLESIVVRFQRLVSDLSKELNKEIEFRAEGMDTKIDKSIIEKLTDPLLHLLRNSLDHGIENPAERKRKGKDPKGTVLLKSYYSGANVVVEISDDGAGINLERIREKAINKGLIDAGSQLSERELVDLIFVPGFSTATKVTDVSGRGVGMDVVKRNITDIRGEVTVTTSPERGTTFIIRLPLTLSILDGLLVRIGDTDFLLPLTAVAKCYEVETATLESTYNQWVTLEGKRTPFIFLRNEFAITQSKPHLSQIINVPFDGGHVGLAVDKIIGEYQAVLKPLGHYYQKNDEFSGATILGNGTVALVLDANKLIRKLTTDIKSEIV